MIPGITDRRRLPRLGKIRLGEKAKGARGEYPKKLDHFNFKDVPEVAEVYGDDCKELPIVLPADDVSVFFPTARKAYRTSGLFCACDDGEIARRVRVPIEANGKGDHQGEAFIKAEGLSVKPGEMFELPCPGESCDYFERKMCKNLGRLLFILPEIPRFGVYEIATTSYNSIVNVMSMTEAIRSAVGTVAGIPLTLCLKPMKVQPKGKATTVYVLELEFRGSYQTLATIGKQLRAAGGGAAALLGPAPEEPPDDLYPYAGQGLDAALGQADEPPKGKLAPEPGEGKLDDISRKLAGRKHTTENGEAEAPTGGNDDDGEAAEPSVTAAASSSHPPGCMCNDCKASDLPDPDEPPSTEDKAAKTEPAQRALADW